MTEAEITVTACATSKTAVCPACQQTSSRLHSFYTRIPADLPISGQTVRLSLRVRRFRCQNQTCHKRTFVEPLPEVVARSARQTKRLRATLKLFAVALSGQAGERLLKQLGMAVSGQTLLRLAKSIKAMVVKAPEILGVDDFAFKRGRTYGAILVDLRTHRPVDLLPERTADALSLWLRSHPGVLIMSRDRSTEFARGASDGAPEAVQIADRFPILQNLREACERALKRIHAELIEQHKASGLAAVMRYQRRRSQTEIAASKVARLRRLAQGCRNANQLWEELKAQGFTGSYKPVNHWLAPRREKPGRKHSLREKDLLGLTQEEEAGTTSQQSVRTQERNEVEPVALEAPRHLVWLLLKDPDVLNQEERRSLEFIRRHPGVETLYGLTRSFVKLIKEQDFEAFDLWLTKGESCGLPDFQTFTAGLQNDYQAVKNSLLLPYSNGPVEGQINRLKFVKRSMYGRGSFQLLRSRFLEAA